MSEAADYKATIRQAVLAGDFLRLTFSSPGGPGMADDKGPWQDRPAAWEKVSLRPVSVGGRLAVQFAFTAGKRHLTKNYEGDELAARLEELLAAPFHRVELQRGQGDMHVRITRKGRPLVSSSRPSRPQAQPSLAHDRRKSYLLPANPADEFLLASGIVGPGGKVKAGMAAKFHQVNEFLRAIEPIALRLASRGERSTGILPVSTAGILPAIASSASSAASVPSSSSSSSSSSSLKASETHSSLFLVDCGCGNAHLTFAAFHYLRHIRGLDVTAVGVDRNADLIRNCTLLRDRLRWPQLDFQVGEIADFRPSRTPDIVVSLHACDTATDQAIGLGVRWGGRAILAAPCCQHELHHAIRHRDFEAMLRHGTLRERLADLLTDALRAAALRAAGYVARVFEFVSPEHTGKNVMIAAEKVDRPAGDLAAAAREYLKLRQFWNVAPFIEKALGDDFRLALDNARKGDRTDGRAEEAGPVQGT